MGKVAPSCEIEENNFLTNSKYYPGLVIAAFLAIIIQYVFNALGSSGPDGTIFVNSTGDLSDKYRLDITPAGWTFSIWGFIYAWQASWIIFSLVNICRKSSDGNPAYKDPPFLPNTLYILQIIICCFNIGWLIAFDREEIELAFAFLVIYTLLQYLALQQVVRRIFRVSPKLIEQRRKVDFWLTQGLVCNGIGIQMAWVNIATLLNMQMVMIYRSDDPVDIETAGTVALSILAAHVLILPAVDMILLDRYLRYTITPYIVVVVALGGSISKNWDEERTNSIYSAVLIAFAGVLLIVKLIVTMYRHSTRPSYRTKSDQWEVI